MPNTVPLFIRLTLLWFGIILTGCPAPMAAAREQPHTTKSPTYHHSVVMVLGYNEKTGSHQQATGFFVNHKGDIATSFHAIAQMDSIDIWSEENGGFPVNAIIATDPVADLAILAVDIPAHAVHPAPIALALPTPGETIQVIGHPHGRPQRRSQGIVTALFPTPSIKTLLQISAPFTNGESGSPLFNASGEVIGIASFIIFLDGGREKRYFAIPATRLQLLKTTQSLLYPRPVTAPGYRGTMPSGSIPRRLAGK